MIDPDIKIENGRVWRRSSTEGITKWVSADPRHALTYAERYRPQIRLKPLVVAIRLTLMR